MGPSTTMAFRGGNRNRSFGGNYGGGNGMGGGRMNPWDTQGGGAYGGGGMRQGGGGGPMNAEALSLANNLLNNLLRNQPPPSLLDLPRGGGGMNRNRGPIGNRPGGNIGGGGGGNRNRRPQGGFGGGRGINQKPGANKNQGGGIRKQNAFDRAKKLLAKNSNPKKKDSASGDKTDNSKKESVKESPYADVPNDMFYCHLCKKHMWDANSFENHIKGRTHLMMREGIEESYRLKANMIRQEAKIAEQLKSIELDRLKRMGKQGKNRNLEYCTMCDLNFHGHLSAHRKSDGHLQLKKFLHPKCPECSKEFPTRIEFDSHLLSPEHLKKAAEKNTKVGERKTNTLTILTEEDEIKDVRPPQKKKKKVVPAADVKKEGEEGAEEKSEEKKEENGEEGAEVAEGEEEKKEGDEAADETKEGDELNETNADDEEEVALAVDPEDVILDYTEGEEVPTEVDTRLPKYNWTRPVGTSLITKLECIECALCAKFFDTEKTAEIHSRTMSHHRQFLKFINEKSSDTKIAQKRAAAALEESERKKRKLEEASAEVKVEDAEGDEKANDELYDPSEATGDDEDVEMAENANGEDAEIKDAEEEVNGKEDEEMDAQESEPVKEEEPIPEPEPVVEEKPVEVAKPAPEAAKPAPATPAPVAASPTKGKASPATTRAAANTPKATPRGRGRGRYNRY